MDGIHDLGGMDGFGAVVRVANEPDFHAEWEAKVFALSAVLDVNGVIPSGDAFRHSIERIDPLAYLTHGYYGRWLAGLEGLLIEHGVISDEELRQAVAAIDTAVKLVTMQSLNPPWSDSTSSAEPDCKRALDALPQFTVGQLVHTRSHPSPGHTRLPRYARGKTGVIHKVNGGWVYPDSNAHGLGEDPQHLYSVGFTGDVLWGSDGDPKLTVYLDLFESYLSEI